jgi:hypothetical protein
LRRQANREAYRRRNQNIVRRFLAVNPCVDCGEGDIRVLEFDHVFGRKVTVVSDLVRNGRSIRKLRDEIAKCVVRCANCHRKKTAADFGWYKGTDSPNPNGLASSHLLDLFTGARILVE